MKTNLEWGGHLITTHGPKASPNSYRRPGLSTHLLLIAAWDKLSFSKRLFPCSSVSYRMQFHTAIPICNRMLGNLHHGHQRQHFSQAGTKDGSEFYLLWLTVGHDNLPTQHSVSSRNLPAICTKTGKEISSPSFVFAQPFCLASVPVKLWNPSKSNLLVSFFSK